MKYELEITMLKISMMEDEHNNQLRDLRFDNVDLRSKLTKATFELQSTRLKHNEFEKYNFIVKGEIV